METLYEVLYKYYDNGAYECELKRDIAYIDNNFDLVINKVLESIEESTENGETNEADYIDVCRYLPAIKAQKCTVRLLFYIRTYNMDIENLVYLVDF